jgi:hypothetical protein
VVLLVVPAFVAGDTRALCAVRWLLCDQLKRNKAIGVSTCGTASVFISSAFQEGAFASLRELRMGTWRHVSSSVPSRTSEVRCGNAT